MWLWIFQKFSDPEPSLPSTKWVGTLHPASCWTHRAMNLPLTRIMSYFTYSYSSRTFCSAFGHPALVLNVHMRWVQLLNSFCASTASVKGSTQDSEPEAVCGHYQSSHRTATSFVPITHFSTVREPQILEPMNRTLNLARAKQQRCYYILAS